MLVYIRVANFEWYKDVWMCVCMYLLKMSVSSVCTRTSLFFVDFTVERDIAMNWHNPSCVINAKSPHSSSNLCWTREIPRGLRLLGCMYSYFYQTRLYIYHDMSAAPLRWVLTLAQICLGGSWHFLLCFIWKISIHQRHSRIDPDISDASTTFDTSRSRIAFTTSLMLSRSFLRSRWTLQVLWDLGLGFLYLSTLFSAVLPKVVVVQELFKETIICRDQMIFLPVRHQITRMWKTISLHNIYFLSTLYKTLLTRWL